MAFQSQTQAVIADIFLEQLRASDDNSEDLALAGLLTQKQHIVFSGKTASLSAVDAFVAKIPARLLPRFVELDAKLIDVQWRARKAAGIMLLNTLAAHGGVRTGDKYVDVVKRLAAAQLTPTQVQSLVDDALVWPSLTTHPTNPTSLAYTKAGMELDAVLCDPQSSRQDIRSALRRIIATSMNEQANAMGSKRKTPDMEAEELIAVLHVLYRSVPGPLAMLRAALAEHGYPTVSVRSVLDVHVWGPGDADGNPNMTAPVVQSFITKLRAALFEAYSKDVEALVGTTDDKSSLLRTELSGLIAALRDRDAARVSAGFDTLLRQLRSSPPNPTSPLLVAILDKYATFGTAFARIDIRHNSRDIMLTVGKVLELTDSVSCEEFLKMSVESQANLLRSRLQDATVADRTRAAIGEDGVRLRSSDVAYRVFTRMLVVAKHPQNFQKFIIAETTSVANVLAALFLVWCTGGPVMDRGATLDIVPLFESRDDLRDAPRMVHELLTDASYSSHARARGYVLAMIAKSDTARLSGPGVQGAQEETIGLLLSMNPANYNGVRMHVMLGGGDDQMRGGGRIVESPHVVLRAQAHEGGCNSTKIAMTVQGMQLQLLFGAPLLASYFIEGFSAQCMLGNARAKGWVPWRKPHESANEVAALHQTRIFFNAAMDNYERFIGPQTESHPSRRTIVDYLNGFPGEIIEWTNKSSRPGARQATADPLQGRAISLDQRAKHDGAYITATLGVCHALELLEQMLRCGNPLAAEGALGAHRHAYIANKSFRDFVRLQATILYQKDYHMAWSIRGGVPSFLERKQLESAYVRGGYNPPRVFLAHIEHLDRIEAFILCYVITGQRPTQEVELKAPLSLGWPEFANQLRRRDRLSMVAKRLELKAIRRINRAKATRRTLAADLEHLAFYSYVGVNPSCSSPNFNLTMTDPFKEDGNMLLSEANPGIVGHLPTLNWCTSASKL